MRMALEKDLWGKTNSLFTSYQSQTIPVQYKLGNVSGKRLTKTCLYLPEKDFFKFNEKMTVFFHQSKYNNYIHQHEFYKIIYIIKGEVGLGINGHEYSLSEGNIFILNPLDKQYVWKYNDHQDLMLNILISKDLVNRSMFHSLFLNFSKDFFNLKNSSESNTIFAAHTLGQNFDSIIDTMLTEYLADDLYREIIVESSLQIILSLIFRTYYYQNYAAVKKDSLEYKIIEYIDQNFTNISLKKASLDFHYNPKYFSDLVYKETGKKFSTLVQNRCIQEAFFYLLNTDFSIEKIISLCGYKNKTSFYNIFKKEINCTPSEFRLKNKKIGSL